VFNGLFTITSYFTTTIITAVGPVYLCVRVGTMTVELNDLDLYIWHAGSM